MYSFNPFINDLERQESQRNSREQQRRRMAALGSGLRDQTSQVSSSQLAPMTGMANRALENESEKAERVRQQTEEFKKQAMRDALERSGQTAVVPGVENKSEVEDESAELENDNEEQERQRPAERAARRAEKEKKHAEKKRNKEEARMLKEKAMKDAVEKVAKNKAENPPGRRFSK